MNALLNWLTTIPFLLACIVTLLVWHPLLATSARINRSLFHRLVGLGNGILLCHLRITGKRVRFLASEKLPPEGPLLVISNHQSFFDIPLFIWYLRRYRPRFVAKKELARGFPSASLVLRRGGSALIDRSNAKQAVPVIEACGEISNAEGDAVVIFPEGSRGRDGRVRPFKPGGVMALAGAMPDAVVVIAVISGSWKLGVKNFFPVLFGTPVELKILRTFPVRELTPERFSEIESEIRAAAH